MLILPVDEKLLKAIHRLQFNEDYQLRQEYFVKELARIRADNDTAQGPQLLWQQGAVQVLAELILQDETVQDALYKLSKKPTDIRRKAR